RLLVVAVVGQAIGIEPAEQRHRLRIFALLHPTGRGREGGDVVAALVGAISDIGLAPGRGRRRCRGRGLGWSGLGRSRFGGRLGNRFCGRGRRGGGGVDPAPPRGRRAPHPPQGARPNAGRGGGRRSPAGAPPPT